MHLHEFQSKQLLKKAGMAVPKGVVFGSVEELEEKWPSWAESGGWLKAQVHAGGRGMAGGVLFGSDRNELFHKAKQLFQHRIVNQQTGPSGLPIQTILLSEPVAIVREQYLALIFSPAKKNYLFLAAQGGGMEIEMRPKKEVLTFPLPSEKKLRSYHRLLLHKHMGLGELSSRNCFSPDRLPYHIFLSDGLSTPRNQSTRGGYRWAFDCSRRQDKPRRECFVSAPRAHTMA